MTIESTNVVVAAAGAATGAVVGGSVSYET